MGGSEVWTTDTQTFVLHNAPIYNNEDADVGDDAENGGDDGSNDANDGGNDDQHATLTACALLVDAPVVPLLPRTLPPPPPDPSPPYIVVGDAGWKGAGLFAARDIPAGALIFVDRPLAIVPSDLRLRAPFDALLARLTPRACARLLALANVKPLEQHPAVEGIALTNAVRVALPVPPSAAPQEYGAVFPRVSRANHSCALHVSVKWDPATLSAGMYALRPFRAGEEINNQYVDVLAPRATRQSQLARYGFACACAHCALPTEEERAASDAARAELRAWGALHLRLGAWAGDLCRADDALLHSHTRALELAEKESLHGMRVPLLDDIARAYALLGDEPRFREVAGEVVRLCAGLDPPRAERFARWIADPRTFGAGETGVEALGGWGSRARRRMLLEKRKDKEREEDVDISVPW
ncbi:hypothetical protein FB451DRAFT_1386098 [Mycena latifolia]|nr:hypothetical protein FB451DRAFT_1386098 [Mycena latifolia]